MAEITRTSTRTVSAPPTRWKAGRPAPAGSWTGCPPACPRPRRRTGSRYGPARTGRARPALGAFAAEQQFLHLPAPTEAELTVTNGPFGAVGMAVDIARRDLLAGAAGPDSITRLLVRATLSSWLRRWRKADPSRSWWCRRPRGRSQRAFSRRSCEASMARDTTTSNWSILKASR